MQVGMRVNPNDAQATQRVGLFDARNGSSRVRMVPGNHNGEMRIV